MKKKYKSKTDPMIITGGSVYCKNCGYQYKWEGSYPISPYCPKCNKKINWNDYDLPREEKQMKFDYHKILDFSHEFARFCNSQSDCKDCTLFNGSCLDLTSITQADIDIIQEWSNTHPQKTRLQAFQEIFPKFDNFVPDGTICFFHLIGKPGLYCKDAPMAESYCKECWNLPYNDEFEKSRKEEEE